MLTTKIRSVLGAIAVTLWSLGVADATVTQVDGTIIPTGNGLQGALNGEGETLDAKLDAAELPQVFLPNTTKPVVFRDFAEFAGYENSFGWYNVGDDVLTDVGRRTNLHPIFGCGATMQNHPYDPGNPGAHANHHHGDPASYVINAEAGSQISVDFAAEQTAARYKGGFIAFYLITPDGGSPNCGDYITGETFGRIYFTQKDLNNDGDFVHHLVYTSGIDPEKFYFGFEDLYRGGDNDFTDMTIWVKGLEPPCTPTAEVCDGIDNDCDGLIDNADVDLLGTGDACTCDGVAMTCADGAVFGVCQGGLTVCLSDEIQCKSNVAPSPEVCDGLDNNCNNAVDDDPTDAGAPCDGPDSDLCQEGVEVCDMGTLVCDDNTGPNLEVCDGADNDCDGIPDNNLTDEGGVCGTDVGECQSGTEVCDTGRLVCQGETGPSGELCDALDNDCDGVIDDTPTDVGVQCGTTNVGECDFGLTICNSGTLECAGEVGPVPETCDTKDNDCNGAIDDNPIDIGQPCGSDVGVCKPGLTICTPTGPVCSGETGGSAELCNRLDDDCNGVIDDNPTDVGGVCGETQGICEPGNLACIDGAPQCIGGVSGGTETCNGLDDDCDGMTDEGVLCEGGECKDGTCSAPCAPGEFPCPIGLVCQNDFCVTDACYGIVCPSEANGDRNVCDGGTCVPVCNTITCSGDQVCRPSDGACVPNTCEFLDNCTDSQLCKIDECVDNPCFEVTCPEAEFCRSGSCIKSCGGVACAVGEVCQDGACEPTGCTTDCPDGTKCDADSDACIDDPCTRIDCDKGQVCDPGPGTCVDDPCFGVTCPDGQTCNLGNCFDPPKDSPDAGPPKDYVYAGGGGGCAVGGDSTPPWFWLMAIGGAFALGVGRKRAGSRRVVLWLALLSASVFFGALSCNIDGYCLNCATGGADGDGGFSAADAGNLLPDAEPPDAGGPGCQDGVVFPEICDGFDNDCDGPVDEDFDLQTDRENCGECGKVCEKPGAIAVCTSGSCDIAGCFPGNVDLDGDATGPFDDSNGCEYKCFVSNGGVEACDKIDNDCDGDIDEDTSFATDANNCGECGRVCSFFAVTGATCTGSVCGFNGATDCNAGFFDINGTQADGCEYSCTPSNGGVEACDLRDNNCDGVVDDGFDTTADPANCGQCGNACSFPHATAICMTSTCVFNPNTDCAAGFHDVNGDQLDGCEYSCTITNGGVEICDSIDNDCNGIADDGALTVGNACNNAPSGTATGECTNTGSITCASGTLLCVGAPEPTPETCDNKDNDCNGSTDDGVTRSCYTGAMGTQGIGTCKGGTEQCVAGAYPGPCVGEVLPSSEICDNKDNDCDADVDEDAGGVALARICYTGTAGTAGFGECQSGIETCTFGVYGVCAGEVTDLPFDICGDSLDTDCDNLNDAQEGCLGTEAELRLDAAGGTLGTNPGAEHSFDIQLASGGSPLGSRVYAAWSDLSNGNSDIYFRRSTDGGVTWTDIVNLTGGLGRAAVKPLISVAPAAGGDTVFVSFQSVNGGVRDIRYVISTDSGAGFGGVSGRLDGGEDAFHHDAAITPDGQTILIAWEALDTNSLTRDIFSRVSTDGGSSFKATRTINVGSGSSPVAGRPKVGITSAGRYVWAWREIRAGSTPDIFTAFSDDDTAAIAGPAELRIDSDGADTRNSDFPQLAVVGSSVYLVWQDISTLAGGGSDVVFARSSNSAASFASEQIIDDPSGEVSSSFTPVMAVDSQAAGGSDDRIFLAWEDRRQGTQIYASTSTNGGTSFSAAVRASNDGGNTITGVTRRPTITFAGGDVAIIAYNNDLGLGTTTEHVFTTSTIDAGTTWSYTHQRIDGGAGKALSPVVTRSSGSGLVNAGVTAWTDFRSGTGINGDTYSRRVGQ